ncbi:MAG: hypothetical protein IJW89_06785, partial [Clostridia bacterium]|nr:hypothetical protein [Clostridia bacterium]
MSDKKILVCSISCWNQKTGSDTFSTLLEGYGADRVANVYFSESVPDSSVCARYFRISENAVVKSVINRKIATGAEVSAGVPQTENAQNEAVTARRYRRFSN